MSRKVPNVLYTLPDYRRNPHGSDLPFPPCARHATLAAGPVTGLPNLDLFCHHHGLIEPAKHALRHQWWAWIANGGLPEFAHPRWISHSSHDASRAATDWPTTPASRIDRATRMLPDRKTPKILEISFLRHTGR